MSSGRVERARSLRRRSGLAEQRVWSLLRAGGIDGLKFRRQHPVGPYVVDFACDPLRLVIEIDGGVHGRDDVALEDHYRQSGIEALGWTVLRFSNTVALEAPKRITDAIRDHFRRTKAPSLPAG
ncbi:endonuclease domain-containing protein [Brevundimonas sp.]|uniref:endonuclease domain-containing protein n=1 Tax=Brevundimonas sp. TaxID=1871086 RepID=UPI0025C11F6F|nr:endonuclease domain-containing protein [Brevundimonas sp.]